MGDSSCITCNDEEFSEIKWVDVCDLWWYITNKKLLASIDLDELLKILINITT